MLSETGRLRLIGIAAAGVTFAVLGLVMLSPVGKRLAMPGPLRSFHAPLREDCAHCHEATATSIQSVFGGLAATQETRAQSTRCLVCHNQIQAPDRPHGLTSEPPLASKLHQQCATCHREHQGRSESLVSLSNKQCQSCHESTFDSFAEGHPEFASDYGCEQQSIQFDHAQHLREHLPERGISEQESCTGCHTLGDSDRRMSTRSFEASCAACHEEEILGSKQVDGRGLTVLGLPAIDLMTLEESALELGAWPADAEFCETQLSPFLALLLSVDPEARRELAEFNKLDPLDLQDASLESQQVALSIAWRIKQLCAELLREGHAGLEARLEKLAGRELEPGLLGELCGGLSSEVASTAIRSWFPELEQELMQRSTGERVLPGESNLTDLDYDSEAARENWVQRGGWYRQDLDPSLRYRPRGHDDSFIQAWIEFTHGLASNSSAPAATELLEELAMPDTAGVCAKCHDLSASSASFTWRTGADERAKSSVTHFAHGTHLPMLADRDCSVCHELSGGDSETNFQPIARAVCLDCHGDQGASAACTTCHDYHVSSSAAKLTAPSLAQRILAATPR